MIGHLLDHVANVHRLSETVGAYREIEQSYTEVYTALPCTFQRRNTVIGRQTPGEREIGDRDVYFDVDATDGPFFQNRDIIEVVSGPAGFVGPQYLEVESIAIPRGHHIEIRAVEWKGSITGAGS